MKQLSFFKNVRPVQFWKGPLGKSKQIYSMPWDNLSLPEALNLILLLCNQEIYSFLGRCVSDVREVGRDMVKG